VKIQAGLSQREKDSFNHFRYGLHSVTVITFDELLHRLRLLYIDGRTATDEDSPVVGRTTRRVVPEDSPWYADDPPF
jgi:hypothetical protein